MKRKNATKAAILTLFFVLAALPLFAAGEQQGASKQGAAKAASSAPASQDGEDSFDFSKAPNLKGMEIVIGNYYQDNDALTKPYDEADKPLLWKLKFQKELGFHVYEKNFGTSDKFFDLMATSIMAGDPISQIFIAPLVNIMPFIQQNLLAPLNGLADVKLNEKDNVRWHQEILKAMTFGGKTYAVASNPTHAGTNMGLYFNKRILKEAGIDPDSIYTMVEKGTWTWNVFADMCKKTTRDLNNDGIIDIYALATDEGNLFLINTLVPSNGACFVDKDASGKFVDATRRPEFIEAFNFGKSLFDQGFMMRKPEGAKNNYYVDMFNEGKTAFLPAAMSTCNNYLTKMPDDFGFALFPKGPKAKTYRHSLQDTVYAIPATFKPEEVNKVLYAYTLWMRPVNNFEEQLTAYYDMFRDAPSVEWTIRDLLTDTPDNCYLELANMISGYNAARVRLSNQMFSGAGNASQIIESVSQQYAALIAAANATK